MPAKSKKNQQGSIPAVADNVSAGTGVVTIGQAAKILGVSVDTVRRWDKSGTLSSTRPDGKNRYFSVEELERVKFSEPLSISQAAEQLDVSPSTLRRLEAKGLIKPERNPAGERVYDLTSLRQFLRSDYFVRQKEVEEEILKPLTRSSEDNPADTGTKANGNGNGKHDPAVHVLLGEHHTVLANLTKFKKIFLTSLAVAVGSFSVIIVILTILFFLFPDSTAKTFGYEHVNPTSRKFTYQPEASLLARQMRPFSQTALRIVEAVNAPLKEKIDPADPIKDVNDVFAPDSEGNVKSIYSFTFPDTSYLKIPDSGLIVNLNSEFVQGREPGKDDGNLALLPITTDLIKNGAITREKLAPGLALGSGGGGTTFVNTPASTQSASTTTTSSGSGDIEAVIAGIGLSGGGESGSVTLNIGVGDGLTAGADSVSLNLQSGSGLQTSASGLSLIRSCSNNEILKWSGSAWICSPDSGTGGSITIQESDGTPSVNPTTTLQFATSGFTVTDNGGGVATVALGSNVILNTSTPAAGDITGSFSAGLTIGANSVALGSDTTGDYVASITAGNGLTGSASGESSTPVLNLNVQANKGLEVDGNGLSFIDCTNTQILKYNGSAWVCSTDNTGGGSAITVEEGDTLVTGTLSSLDFLGADFSVTDSPAGESNVAIDYTNSGITRRTMSEIISGNWSFNDTSFTLQDSADNTKKAVFELSGISNGTSRSFTLPNVNGTLITTGNLTDINTVGIITTGVWQGSTVGVQHGGTGATSFITNGVVYGNGTGALQASAAGTAGQLLVANASGVPTFVTLSSDATLAESGVLTLANSGVTANTYGSASQVPVFTVDAKGRITTVTNTTISGVAPGGSAGGDLSGTYPNPTVARINGTSLGATTPTAGNILIGDGSSLVSRALSGDLTVSSLGVTAIGNDAVALGTDTTGNYVASITTGSGLAVSGVGSETATANLTIDATTTGTTATTSSNSGLETDASGLRLLGGCGSGEILKWNGTVWNCAADGGGGSSSFTLAGDSGPNQTISSSDTLSIFGGAGITSTTTATDNISLAIGQGSGITVGANDVAVKLAAGTDTTAATSSRSGLEFSDDGGTALLQGCSNNQILKWNSTDWTCAADSTGGGGGGSSVWSDLTDPADNLTLNMTEYASTFNWNTNNTTSAGFNGLSLAITNDGASDPNTQRLLVLKNQNNGISDSGSIKTEGLLRLEHNDDSILEKGIEILSTGGGIINTAIDVSDGEIGTALNVGSNNIVGTTGNILYDNLLYVGTLGYIDLGGIGQLNGSNGLKLSSSGGTQVTLDAGNGNVVLSDTDVLNVGGLTGVAYNALSNAGGTANGGDVADDNDLYVQGALEVDGNTNLGGSLTILGTTVNATNVTTFNCTNCLNFDDFSDALTLDAATTITNSLAGDLAIDLTSNGDLVIKDANTAFAQFLDDGTITFGKAAAASTINIGVGTGADTIHIGDGTTTADTITIGNQISSTSVAINAGTGDLSLASTDLLSATAANQLTLTSNQASASALRFNAANAAGGLDVDAGTGGITADTTGALSLEADLSSDFTVSASGQSLTLEATGGGAQQLILQSAGTGANAVRINTSDAAGGLDVDAGTGGIAMDSTGALSFDSTALASNFNLTASSASTATLSIGAINNGAGTGTLILSADDAVNIDATLAASNVSLTAGTAEPSALANGNDIELRPSDDLLFTPGDAVSTRFTAGGQFIIDGSTNPNTTTTGLLQLNTTTQTAGNVGQASNYTVTNDAAGTAKTYTASQIVLNQSDVAGATTRGLLIRQNAVTAIGSGNSVDAGLVIDNADTDTDGGGADTAAALINAIRIDGTGSGAITTGLNFNTTNITTDLSLQNIETIDNDVDNRIRFNYGATGGALLLANGSTLDTDQAAFNLINTAATTINFGGGATTALNIGSTTTGLNSFNADVDLNFTGSENLQISNSSASTDQISLNSSGIAANGIDGLQVTFGTTTGAGTNNSALHAILSNSPVDSGDVVNGLEVNGVNQTVASTIQNLARLTAGAGSNSAGTLNGLSIDSIGTSGGSATENAIKIGTGWDNDINFTDTSAMLLMSAADNTSSLSINDASGNNLFNLKDLNTNFGSAATAGAFIGRNSYFGDEFNLFRQSCSDTTAGGTVQARGDMGSVGLVGCAIGAGEFTTSSTPIGLGASCSYSSNNAVNGFERIQATSGATASTSRCMESLTTNLALANYNIFNTTNLPVVTMKARINSVTANDRFYAGMSTQNGTATAAGPGDGVYFSNCTTSGLTPSCGANINGVVVAGGNTSFANCGTNTGTMMFLRIEVRSVTDVHFFADLNVADGITETECGTGLSTNVPNNINMTAIMNVGAETTGRQVQLDVDYYRAWQDDNVPTTGLDGDQTVAVAPVAAGTSVSTNTTLGVAGDGRFIITGAAGDELLAIDQAGDASIKGGLTASGLDINLKDDGDLVITSGDKQQVVRIDSAGNATFAGTLTADKIIIGEIDGLESLEQQYADQSSAVNDQLANFDTRLSSLEAEQASAPQQPAGSPAAQSSQVVTTQVGERYFTNDDSIENGDVVTLDLSAVGKVKKGDAPYAKQLVGVATSGPGLLLDNDGSGSSVIVALAGTVSVKVSTENGAIEPGDPLTSSSRPGVAMKATKPGPIVGKAVSAYSAEGVNRILVQINNGFSSESFAEDLVNLQTRVGSLEQQITDLNSPQDTVQTSETGITNEDGQDITLGAVNVETMTVQLDLIVKGSLVVDGPATFKQMARFEAGATIDGELNANGETNLNGRTNVNNNTAGFASINPGETSVRVTFAKPQSAAPVINLTLGDGKFAQYSYRSVSANGFEIVLAQPAAEKLNFSWIALNVNGANTYVNASN